MNQQQKDDMAAVRQAIAAANLKKCEVAFYMGCNETALSKYLTERRAPPPGFVDHALSVIEKMAHEERRKREVIEQWRRDQHEPPG